MDFLDLNSAHDLIKSVAEAIENQSADAVSVSKVMELAGILQTKKEPLKLVVPHRRFVSQTEAFLFNDSGCTSGSVSYAKRGERILT